MQVTGLVSKQQLPSMLDMPLQAAETSTVAGSQLGPARTQKDVKILLKNLKEVCRASTTCLYASISSYMQLTENISHARLLRQSSCPVQLSQGSSEADEDRAVCLQSIAVVRKAVLAHKADTTATTDKKKLPSPSLDSSSNTVSTAPPRRALQPAA